MNTFQKMIGASLLIASLSLAYYFVIFMPQKEIFKLQLQKQEQINKQKIIPSSTLTPTFIPTSIPQPTNITKNAKAECATKIISKTNSALELKGVSLQDLIFVINLAYKKCLAENNLSPEDLVTSSGKDIIIDNKSTNLNTSFRCSTYTVGGYIYTNCN